MSVHPPAWIVAASLAAAFVSAATIAFADGNRPATRPAAEPSPDLKPADVVRAVVDALGKNDATDAGIRTTFKFASPGNQAATGPIDRFIPLVKSPAYAPLLSHKTADVKELSIDGDSATELVTLIAADGTPSYYLFQLTRQTDAGPLKGCWMTDGVVPVEPRREPGTKV